MAKFSLVIKRSAQKELDDLNNSLFERIDAKIIALTEEPKPPGSRKLAGVKDHWRIRIGDYRVIYSVDEIANEITVVKVAHRGSVYE